MDSLRFKTLKFIIGQNKRGVIEAVIEIQNNHFKLHFNKKKPATSVDVAILFNKTVDKTKDNSQLHREAKSFLNNSENKKFWVDEKCTEFNKEWKDTFSGVSIPVLEWLSTIANTKVDKEVIKCIPGIVANIKSYKLPKLKGTGKTKREFGVYLGNNPDMRGMICILDNSSHTIPSTHVLVPGENNKHKKIWCLQENIKFITNEKEDV